MTLENARVLREELLKVDRTNAAKDLERRYPELAEREMSKPSLPGTIEKPKPKGPTPAEKAAATKAKNAEAKAKKEAEAKADDKV